jgi:hypothetical protein
MKGWYRKADRMRIAREALPATRISAEIRGTVQFIQSDVPSLPAAAMVDSSIESTVFSTQARKAETYTEN